MSTSYRLGYMVPEFPRQTHVFFWRECQELRRLGVEPVFISTRRPAADACPHAFGAEATAATHYLFPPSAAGVLSLLARPVGVARALRRWLSLGGSAKARLRHFGLIACAGEVVRYARRQGVSHIHVHSCADAALVALFAQDLGGPTYSLTLHNPLWGHGPNQREKWANARFAVVVAKSFLADVSRELKGHLPPHVYVAPMGVDLDRFDRPSPYLPWMGDGPLRIFACGRLNPCKGHDLLIAAVRAFVDDGLDVVLEIAGADQDSGSGQFLRDLEELIGSLKLTDRVTLAGALTEDEIRQRLDRAHLFVLASRSGEAMPVVLIEAMAMRLPVVATEVGGTTELVRYGENGFVVPPGDVPALTAAVRRIATDPALATRFGVAGRATVEAGFGSGRSAATLAAALGWTAPAPAENVEVACPALWDAVPFERRSGLSGTPTRNLNRDRP